MKVFECSKCGNSAGLKMLSCSATRHGACPYRIVSSRIPAEKEDINSALLILGVSIFLLIIYPESLNSGSFLAVILNLCLYGTLLTIAIFATLALSTFYFGRYTNIVSREKGQLWQSRSIKDYQYYVRVVSNLANQKIENPQFLAENSIQYITSSERAVLSKYTQEAESEKEPEVIGILIDVFTLLLLRMAALNLITIKRGNVYVSSWKKVEDYQDSTGYFIFLNQDEVRSYLQRQQLDPLEQQFLKLLVIWNSKEQESENFLAPDLRELLSLFSDNETLKKLCSNLVKFSQPEASFNMLDKKTAFLNLHETSPKHLNALHQEFSVIFKIYSPKISTLITRLGWRLRRKQVRVAIVACALLIFFFSRIYSPVMHAGKLTQAVKNIEFEGEMHTIDDELLVLTDELIKEKTIPSGFERIKQFFGNLFTSSQEALQKEYEFSTQDLNYIFQKLKHSSETYKLLILERLRNYRGDLNNYVANLKTLLSDQSSAVKIKTLQMLAELKGEAHDALDDVTRLLDDKSTEVQREALKTLKSMESKADGAVPQIAKIASNPESALRPYAIDTLKSINTPQAQQALRSLGLY